MGNWTDLKPAISYQTKDAELRNTKVLYALMSFFLFADWFLPEYFGVHVGFDFTATRIMNVMMIFYFFMNPSVGNLFFSSIFEVQVTKFLALYMFVIVYTTVLRANINTFFLNFLEILTFYMMCFAIRYVIGVRKAIQWTVKIAWVLGIYGLIEFACKQSLSVKLLMTVPNAAVSVVRSGQYRDMGTCLHPIAYGMMLLLLIGVISIDYENDTMYLFQHPVLYVLLMLNVFLTGSRGPLGLAFLESALIVLFSRGRQRQKTIMYVICMLVVFSVIEAIILPTSMGQYIMRQIMSVVDEALGTEYAGLFGADTTLLNMSSDYRDKLPKIFLTEWLNPIVGRGANAVVGFEIDGLYIQSIDNFYVALYIRYGYPGMITFTLFFVMTIVFMLKTAVQRKSGTCMALAIAVLVYCIGLWWVDYLQTTRYLYILIAIYASYFSVRKSEERKRYE